jgi:PKD repeat protein
MRKFWLSFTGLSMIVMFADSCRKDELLDLSAVSFTYSHPTGILPVAITFVATVPASNTVAWNFGDGQTGSGISPVHTYAAQGIYGVVLTTTSPDGVITTRTDSVKVFPYTQLTISQITVTIPHPAYMHYTLVNSQGNLLYDAAFANDTTTGVSMTNNPFPLLVVTDLQHSMTVEIWNYTSIISRIYLSPKTYIQNTLPFPTVFSGSESQGRTASLNVTWN